MCNLYSMTKGQDAIRALFDAPRDETGNLPVLDAIYPDYHAPVVANAAQDSEQGPDQNRTLTMMRWGMPSPSFALKNRNYDKGITNIRNTASPHWRRWLGVQHRCIVPFTAFAEPDARANRSKTPVWFAIGADMELACFAGIWTRWTSVRKVKDGETTDNLFGFLTCDANADVGAVHPKAMPVILTKKHEIETWLTAPTDQALQLQRPLADGLLQRIERPG